MHDAWGVRAVIDLGAYNPAEIDTHETAYTVATGTHTGLTTDNQHLRTKPTHTHTHTLSLSLSLSLSLTAHTHTHTQHNRRAKQPQAKSAPSPFGRAQVG